VRVDVSSLPRGDNSASSMKSNGLMGLPGGKREGSTCGDLHYSWHREENRSYLFLYGGKNVRGRRIWGKKKELPQADCLSQTFIERMSLGKRRRS